MALEPAFLMGDIFKYKFPLPLVIDGDVVEDKGETVGIRFKGEKRLFTRRFL